MSTKTQRRLGATSLLLLLAGFVVAVVVLRDDGDPDRCYLVKGSDWASDESGCLGFNQSGGKAGPYYEIRTTAMKHRQSLAKYDFDAVCSTL